MSPLKPADQPSIIVCQNASRPDLVVFGVGGSSMPTYNIAPAQAIEVAEQLVHAAAEARHSSYLAQAAVCTICDEQGRIHTGTLPDGTATHRASLCRHDATEVAR